MTVVVNFPVEKVRPVKRVQGSDPAEVLIFPGIRIERGEFSLSDRLPKASCPNAKSVRSHVIRDQERF